jgi:LmbE family N-acetylglucosaminyl deacetylase
MTTAGDFQRAWRALPFGGLDDIIGGGTCLILAPHPDDESLGCGGLIAACVAAGRDPLVAVLTDSAGSHPNSRAYPPERLRAVRAQEARGPAGHLGLSPERLVFLNEPDTAAPHDGPRFEAVVARLLTFIRRQPGCSAILAPWRHDPHCDHAAASLAAGAAAHIAGVRHVAYPVWGWTLPEASPVPRSPAAGWQLDIGVFLPAKRAAIRAHQSQYGGLIADDPDGFQLPRNCWRCSTALTRRLSNHDGIAVAEPLPAPLSIQSGPLGVPNEPLRAGEIPLDPGRVGRPGFCVGA